MQCATCGKSMTLDDVKCSKCVESTLGGRVQGKKRVRLVLEEIPQRGAAVSRLLSEVTAVARAA